MFGLLILGVVAAVLGVILVSRFVERSEGFGGTEEGTVLAGSAEAKAESATAGGSQTAQADRSRPAAAESGEDSLDSLAEAGSQEGSAPRSAAEVFEGMSLEEKVGQLLFLGLTPGPVFDDLETAAIQELTPGGVVLFHWNVEGPDQVERYIGAMQAQAASSGAGIRLLVSADQEGGLIVRLGRGFTQFPGAMALGAAGSMETTRRVSAAAAAEMRSVGFNMNLAPVIDINTEPRNEAIGIRAFSDAPQSVIDHSLAWIAGHKEIGVASVAKHFPGLGAATSNTDFGPTVIGKDLDELRELDLVPFQAAVDAGVEAMMISLASYPRLERGVAIRPAALSDRLATRLLREEMGFTGVLITDALTSVSVAEGMTVPETAVDAFRAGADMLMVVMDGEVEWLTHQALVAFVEEQGAEGLERLNSAVSRILSLKAGLGLFSPDPLTAGDIEPPDEILSVAASAALDAVTMYSRDVGSWKPITDESVFVVEFAPDPIYSFRAELGLDLSLIARLRANVPQLESVSLSHSPSAAELDSALTGLAGVDVVIVALRDGWRQPAQIKFAREAVAISSRTIIVALWSPYDLASLTETDATLLATFGDNPVQLEALAEQLISAELPRGIPPVRLP